MKSNFEKENFEEAVDGHIFTELCKELEHFETDGWCMPALLSKEILTGVVVDAGCGTGILSEAAIAKGHVVYSIDINDWGYPKTRVVDFFEIDEDSLRRGLIRDNDFTVIMNPPFSLAELFVKKAFELGARKVVCFQRFSWYEGSYDTGKKRGQFWEKYRPARIWVCGDRATCWRHDLPKNDKGHRFDPVTDKKLANAKTAHAFFVWEKGHAGAAITGHIFKGDAR
ncbi:hypothetical protein KA005_06195 [bacterium]|nr:hypothetical protein [bacterium]